VTVDALLTRPDHRWKIAAHVVTAAFDLQPWMEKPPFSLRNVAVDALLDPDGMRVAGNVGIPEFDSRDMKVDLRGHYAARALHLASADVALDGTPTKVHASGTIAFDGGPPTLDVATRWESLQWPLHEQAIVSSAAGSATLRGSLPYEFSVDAQVVGPNIPAASGTAQGVLSKEQVSISAYKLAALQGSLEGTATLQFAQPRAWKLTTKAVDVNPGELQAQFPGRLSFAASANGTGLSKTASFALQVNDLRGTLRNEPVRASGALQRDRKGWRAQGVSARFADAHLTLDGTLRDTVDARWSLRAPSLRKLLPDAAGSIESHGTAIGKLKEPHVVVEARASDLSYAGWSVRTLSIDADVDASGNDSSRLALVAQGLGRGQPLVSRLQVDGHGLATDHRVVIDVTGIANAPGQAPPHVELQVAGSYAQELWTATVTTTQLTTGDPARNVSIPEPARVLASTQHAALDNLCLVVGAGKLCAEGKWQRNGPWEGTVAGYEIPLSFLLPPSGEQAEYAGRIEGRVHASGAPGQPLQADAGMRIVDAAIVYRPKGAEPQRLNLGTGGLAATAKPDRIDFSFGLQAFTDTYLYANAHLKRDGSNDLLRMPLTGDLRARAADANVLPLVVPDIDDAAGIFTANATFGGTLARPELKGRIELANGQLDSYRVNLALRELSLVANLESDALDFHGSGRAGDGRLETSGKLGWQGGQMKGDLHLSGNNLLVSDLSEYRVVASPDLNFRIDGTQMHVAGDVNIPSAKIQPVRFTNAVRASDDARYVDESPEERAGRLVVHSEIRITMGDDVRIDAFGLQGRVLGGVGTTVHTGETPIGRGELAVDVGKYEAYGQKLEITRGRLLFDSSPLDDPGLDIEARRAMDTITVGLNVRGTLRDPRLTFFSDPSMPQTQIVSYLLTGKGPDSSETSTLSPGAAKETLAYQGGGLLASQLGHRIGLEEVGVESSVDKAGQSNTSLVLGKFLSPRLFISYGISLTESINTLKLRYTITDRWVLKSESGEDQSADLEFTVER
jgi:translocation and assembly module TamB